MNVRSIPLVNESRLEYERKHTLLSNASALVLVKLFLVASLSNRSVAPRLRQGHQHGLLKQLEALKFLDGGLGRLGLVKDHKGLALGLEIGLGDDINHIAVLGEDGAQGLLERLWLDALLEIAYIDSTRNVNMGFFWLAL